MFRSRTSAAALAILVACAALLLPACASSTPEWQRLLVQPGETEQVFETVAFVISRRFPIERRDLAAGVVESRTIEERREDGLYRWRAKGLVRREREGLVVAVSTVVEEFDEEEGFVVLGSVEEIDTVLVGEIEERLRAAAVGTGVRVTRLDPVESAAGADDGAIASLAAPESRPPRRPPR